MTTLAGVKSKKDTGQVPVADVQVALLVDPSGAVTTTVTGLCSGAPVTSMTNPVQPITVQLGSTTPHPEPRAAASTSVVAETARGSVTDRILLQLLPDPPRAADWVNVSVDLVQSQPQT